MWIELKKVFLASTIMLFLYFLKLLLSEKCSLVHFVSRALPVE